jgi:staphylococcal nuclease domain-containing protein 1
VKITISGIIAPRLGHRDSSEDAPYAWAAREHLRQLVIGEMIDFTTDGNFGDRQFSTVYFKGQNVALGLVAKGLVNVKDKGSGPEFEALQEAENDARANGLGVHCDAPNEFATRPPIDRDTDNVKAWWRKLPQGQPLTAIVEWVRDPCTLSCLVVPEFKQVLVSLSGVAGPRIERPLEGQQAVAQPFYYQAKYVTESLMLNRNVELHVESVEGNGTAIGSILTADGNIAEELVRRGFAKVVEWSAKESVSGANYLRKCEAEAQQGGLGVWNGVDVSAASQGGSSSLQPVQPIEVRSGDTVVVRTPGSTEPVMVSLASTNAPRMVGARQRQEGQSDAPWSVEAKEWLRSNVMNADKLMMRVEYTRKIGDNDRPFVSLYNGKNQNLATKLISAGLATCQNHRDGDERSQEFTQLVNSEAEAKSAGRCLHGNKPAPEHRGNNMSESAAKAQASLPSLQKMGSGQPCVVEYVMSGSRFKLVMPREGCTLTFALSGVRTPSHGGGDKTAQPFGNEAVAFTKRIATQRDARVEFEGVDRGGTFLGQLLLDGGSTNIAVELLKQGLGWMDERSASRSPYYAQMEAANEAAKAARIGVWEKYDDQLAQEAEAAGSQMALPDRVQCKVVHVTNGSHFWVHMEGDEGRRMLEAKAKHFQERGDFAAPGPGGRYRLSQYCLAQFQGEYYRAKVLERLPGDKYKVHYIDYGNTSIVSVSDMQTIGADYVTRPEMAWSCKLAHIDAPEISQEYGVDAAGHLEAAVMPEDVQLVAHIVDNYQGELKVMLYPADNNTDDASINAQMLETGCVRLPTGRKAGKGAKIPAGLYEAEESAKKSRRALWEYGDSRADDSDEDRRHYSTR